MAATYTLSHFDRLNEATQERLHNLGLYEGITVALIQRYPFHGPVIIENEHQRIGLRYRVFTQLTGGSNQ
ncbi:MAG: FeoA family protein [Limosilactobacillus gorillae]|jgi:ferrous iron transport protein A|uniref:FeoA family protein n=1 Tax=Limosilactobacillus gorillae TaxID=1450649 RepID=UPI000AB1722A|nr:FeoA family protein [Limosilactobacillus gorillae]MDO4855986.1 FeoA family protein [Limosilactobacillus gorillae]